MPLSLAPVTGGALLGDASLPPGTRLIFRPTIVDTQGPLVVMDVEFSATLDTDGLLPDGFVLARNSAGTGGSAYVVDAVVPVAGPSGAQVTRQRRLGLIQLDDRDAFTLGELLAEQPGTAPGFYRVILQAEVDQILTDAEAARDEADVAAAAAESAAAVAAAEAESAASASVAVGVFASTVEGLAATVDGQTFWVPEGTDFLRLYTNTGGVAVASDVRLALSGLTEGLRRVTDPVEFVGGFGVDRSGYAAVGVLPDGAIRFRRDSESVITPGGDDPFVWGLLDQSGRVALGIRASGQVFANLPADGESGGGATLTRDEVLGLDAANVFGAEVKSDTTRRFLSDIDGTTRGYIQRSDTASTTAIVEDTVLRCIFSYGQSLGVGGTSDPVRPVYSTVPLFPRQSLMLNTGVTGTGSTTAWVAAAAVDFAPAVEALHGPGNSQSETPISGMLDRIAAADAAGRRRPYLGHAAGAGGQAIAALAVGTQPWLNMIAALDRVVAIAAVYRMRVVVDGFVWTQGESNAATDPAEYQAALNAIIAAFRAECDGRGVSPAAGVPVFMDQVSSPAGSGNSRTPNIAFAAIAAADARAFVSTAKYHLTLADTVHLNAPDYRVFGEHIGKAVRAVRDTGTWGACRITGAVLAGGTITLTVHVPVGDLVVDTDTVPAVANHGLRYQDDTSSVSIASVSIGATVAQTCTVTVTLTGAPSGANPRISYAYSTASPLAAPRFGTVGNLRDSDPTPSSVPDGVAGNGLLHNWLLICPPINL